MTRHGYTHITLVVDRSGSMQLIQSDAEGAVNQFIQDQKVVPGEATLTLVEFDAGRHQTDWYHIVYDGDIKMCPSYSLVPRGMTALFDAVGKAINETGAKLASMHEPERPEHVVFVVQTDGQENSSQEFKLEAIRHSIKTQEEHYNWQFLFLGMGPDTFEQGHQMGMSNVTQSADSGAAYVATYAMASSNVADLRRGVVSDLSATNVQVDEEGTVKPS